METTSTKHATDCRRAFGRRDPNCPRCQELANGAAPRRGWGQSRLTRTPSRVHTCSANCGPVCTFGEW